MKIMYGENSREVSINTIESLNSLLCAGIEYRLPASKAAFKMVCKYNYQALTSQTTCAFFSLTVFDAKIFLVMHLIQFQWSTR